MTKMDLKEYAKVLKNKDSFYSAGEMLDGIKIKTVYATPDGKEFDDQTLFLTYMLNCYKLTLEVNMIYTPEDNERYVSKDELINSWYEVYDTDKTPEDFYAELCDKLNTYNKDLEDFSKVEVKLITYRSNGPLYELTGTLNGLYYFCQKQCSHYTLDDPGESLYSEAKELNTLIECLKIFKKD